jgi:hypothetical protein
MKIFYYTIVFLVLCPKLNASDEIYFSKSPNKGERKGELVVNIPVNRHVKELKIFSNNGQKIELDDAFFGKKILTDAISNGKNIIVYEFYAYPKKVNSSGVSNPNDRLKMMQTLAKHKIEFGKTLNYTAELVLDNNEKYSKECSFIIPGPIKIGLMGDSYISGEGCPDYKISEKDYGKLWEDEECHRSKKSGPFKALKDIESDFEDLDIEILNVSCSGATIENLFTSRYEKKSKREPCVGFGDRPEINEKGQIQQIIKTMEYDILITDGGGNNIGFGMVVEGFVHVPIVHEMKELSSHQLGTIYDQVARLPGRYDELASYLSKNSRILFVNYPNITRASDGICHSNSNGGKWFDCWEKVAEISKGYFENLEMRVFDKLNQHIKDACARHKWTLIDVSKRSIGHGICECDEPYFNFPESKSCDIQGDPYGVVHPNYVGTMKIYYQPIYDAVEKAVNEITNKESSLEKEIKAKLRADQIAKLKEKAKQKMRESVDAEIKKIKAEREKREAEQRREELEFFKALQVQKKIRFIKFNKKIKK